MLWVTIGSGRGGMELAMSRTAHKLDSNPRVIVLPGTDRGRMRLMGSVLRDAGEGEIVHSFGGSTALYAELARVAAKGRFKHFAWVRNTVQDWVGGKRRGMIRWGLKRADGRFALSETIAHQLRALGMESSVLKNWIEGDLMPPRANDEGSYLGPMLWCARLAYAKCPEMAIEAHALTRNKRDLLVMGEGEQEGRVKKLASRSPRRDSIYFVGHRSGTMEARREASVLVHASLFDGYPNTILESYAAALPVVSSPAIGIDEVLGNGRWGEKAAGQTPSALASALDKVLDSRMSWGEASHRSAQGAEKHTWDKFAPIYARASQVWGDHPGNR